MANILKAINQINNLEYYAANKDNPLNKAHPVVKLIITLVYIVMVVSCEKYQFLPLLMLATLPVIVINIIDILLSEIGLRLLITLPFAFFASVFNIFIDTHTVLKMFNISISGGMIAFIVVMIKATLSVCAIIILAATTKIIDISMALKKIFVPQILITQLLFTYRYLILLFEDGFNISTAVTLRSGVSRWLKMKDVKSAIGTLLVKSVSRAERINEAMCLRGFTGQYLYVDNRKVTGNDLLTFVGIIILILILRFSDFAFRVGEIFIR